MTTEKMDDTSATNIERLRGHVEDGTLAAILVDTYQSSASGKRGDALKAVAETRLAEIRATLAAEKSSDAPD